MDSFKPSMSQSERWCQLCESKGYGKGDRLERNSPQRPVLVFSSVLSIERIVDVIFLVLPHFLVFIVICCVFVGVCPRVLLCIFSVLCRVGSLLLKSSIR